MLDVSATYTWPKESTSMLSGFENCPFPSPSLPYFVMKVPLFVKICILLFTSVPNNHHTRYYTIASNWNSVYLPPFSGFDINCPFPLYWFDFEEWSWLAFQYKGRNEIQGPDDGIVPIC